jgi:anhydro-N-acetylmuramic acid kinase
LAICATWTAEAIGSSRRWVPGRIDDVIVGGGGVFNRAIMGSLRTVFDPAPVLTFDECGWSSKAFEATAFALLAYDLLRGRCTNVPQVTGARRSVFLGSVVPGSAGMRSRDFYLPR